MASCGSAAREQGPAGDAWLPGASHTANPSSKDCHEVVFHTGSSVGSIHRVTRQLKREQNSLFNCLNSILHDKAFIREIRGLYPSTPLLANLRCGLWYTEPADGTCYFKSTDGHNNNWSFSTTRLNWHVATLAAEKGGAIIVDATRKGKSFTDAFSKTVPIWCAVVNRAVARARGHAYAGQTSNACSAINTPYLQPAPSTSPMQPLHATTKEIGTLPDMSSQTMQHAMNAVQASAHAASTACSLHMDGNSQQSAMCSTDCSSMGTTAPASTPTNSSDGLQHVSSLNSWLRWTANMFVGSSKPSTFTRLSTVPAKGQACDSEQAPVDMDILGKHGRCAEQQQQPCSTLSSSTQPAQEQALSGEHQPTEGTAMDVQLLPTTGGMDSASAAAAAVAHVPEAATQQACAAPDLVAAQHATAAAVPELPSSVPDGLAWDCSLHLPLWVPRNEALQIEARLEGWVDDLMVSGADIRGLEKVLTKPLRPLWISQSSLIWVDQVAQPEDLAFAPLFLVSASQPHSYERKCSPLAGGQDAPAVGPSAGRKAIGKAVGTDGGWFRRSHRKSKSCGTEEDGQLSSGSGSSSNSSGQPAERSSSCGSSSRQQRKQAGRQQRREQGRGLSPPPRQRQDWTYVYVPGAGDDEESWAAGLSPQLFCKHYQELLDAGPTGVHDAVKALLRQQQEGVQQGPCAAASAGLAVGCPTSKGLAAMHVETDQHHLKPKGCEGSPGSGGLQVVGHGIHFLGASGVALASFHAVAAPGVWSHVGAVLNCGLLQHPSMVEAAEPSWQLPRSCTFAGPQHTHNHQHPCSLTQGTDTAVFEVEPLPLSCDVESNKEEEDRREVAHDHLMESSAAPSHGQAASETGDTSGDGTPSGFCRALSTPELQGSRPEASPFFAGSRAAAAAAPGTSPCASPFQALALLGEVDSPTAPLTGVHGVHAADAAAGVSGLETVRSEGHVPERSSPSKSQLTVLVELCSREASQGRSLTLGPEMADAAAISRSSAAFHRGMDWAACLENETLGDMEVLPAGFSQAGAEPEEQRGEQQQQQQQHHEEEDREDDDEEGLQKEELDLLTCLSTSLKSMQLLGDFSGTSPRGQGQAGEAGSPAGSSLGGGGCSGQRQPPWLTLVERSGSLGRKDSFSFCSSPRGLPFHPFISVPLACPREELTRMRRQQREADAARDCHEEAAMNRESASKAGLAYQQLQQQRQQQQQTYADAVRAGLCADAPAGPVDPEHAGGSGHAAGPADPGERPCRYLWLPVESSKTNRTALMDRLAPALTFLSLQLSQGQSVLIHDADGLDQCVCIAVALLLACYEFSPSSSSSGTTGTPSSAPASAVPVDQAVGGCVLEAGQGQPVFVGQFRMEEGRVVLPGDRQVTKHSVRQALAYVSSYYPQARPTRGMLKQVYNFFEQHSASEDRRHMLSAGKVCGQEGRSRVRSHPTT